MNVCCKVIGGQFNEPEKVVLASWKIDGLKEVGKEFADHFEIIVG